MATSSFLSTAVAVAASMAAILTPAESFGVNSPRMGTLSRTFVGGSPVDETMGARALSATAQHDHDDLASDDEDSINFGVNRTRSQTRRQYLAQIGSSIAFASAAAGGYPFPAFADVQNKLNSKSALRNLKRAVKELEEMEKLVLENDYEGVKAAILVPPFTEVRKNCLVLMRGGEDSGEELTSAMDKSYGAFKRDIEDMYNAAGQALRGKKNVDLRDSFAGSVRNLNEFVEVAEKAAALPVQYDD